MIVEIITVTVIARLMISVSLCSLEDAQHPSFQPFESEVVQIDSLDVDIRDRLRLHRLSEAPVDEPGRGLHPHLVASALVAEDAEHVVDDLFTVSGFLADAAHEALRSTSGVAGDPFGEGSPDNLFGGCSGALLSANGHRARIARGSFGSRLSRYLLVEQLFSANFVSLLRSCGLFGQTDQQ